MSALLYGSLSVYLDVSLSVLLSECVFFGVSDHLDVSFSLYWGVCFDVRQAIWMSIWMSVCLAVWMS